MSQQKETASPVDVLIAGAGMAGLIAGCVLAEAGKAVLMVEAADRVGGRMYSQYVAGLDEPIELGAEFVHGMPQDLLSLIDEAGLHLEEVEGADYCFDGVDFSACTEDDAAEDDSSDVIPRMAAFCARHPGEDMSFADFLEQTAFSPRAKQDALRFIEGFNAADVSVISIQALSFQQKAEDAIQGERAFRIREGYSALADYLFGRFAAAGGRLQLATVINRIDWRHRHVTVTGRCGEEVQKLPAAQYAVIALPLGVLQANYVDFQPRPELFASLDALRMGPVLRLTFVFKERFWETVGRPYGDLSFLFAHNTVPGVFWTRYASRQPSMTAWAGGPAATKVDAESFAEQSLQTLSSAFKLAKNELEGLLISAHLHSWNTDELAMSAYSYVRAGGLNNARRLSTSVMETLFFAGEHTDTTGHWGTVHGAMRSGIRAARQILEVDQGEA